MRGGSRPEDIRLSYDREAATYKIRPSYPADLFDSLFERLPSEPQIAEVGPGTGQATEDLLARGASVHAIEIGPAMAAMLRSNLPKDRLRVTVADFEELDLPGGSADAVFSATAYHWITPAAQLNRPAAILRSGGHLAIVELIQVDAPTDCGFFAAAQPIYERFGHGHTGPQAPTRDQVEPALRAALDADHRFLDVMVTR